MKVKGREKHRHKRKRHRRREVQRKGGEKIGKRRETEQVEGERKREVENGERWALRGWEREGRRHRRPTK